MNIDIFCGGREIAATARKVRVEYEGAIYHVINRGDRREDIFRDDRDRERFLETLEETCGKTSWQVHAYCLMRNHFHVVVETPRANLSAGMHWLLGTYTARFNRRHRVVGHLFSGRYKALLVDGSGSGYLKGVCDYVHLNPVRAKLLRPEQRLRAFRWSSYPEYLKTGRRRPGWLRVDRLLGEWGIQRDSATGRRRFEEGMERRKGQEMEQEDTSWDELRRAWCWGEAEFRDGVLELIEQERAEHHYGEEIVKSVERETERLLRDMIKEIGWTERT
ncbi:MAG: transposase [Verrucomicrobiota bacterium]